MRFAYDSGAHDLVNRINDTVKDYSGNKKKVGDTLRSMDITDGPAKLFPGGRLAFDEKGRRKDAKVSIVQFQKGKPVLVYPPASASAAPIWPKSA